MTKFTDQIVAYSKQDPQIAQFVTEIQKFTAATTKVRMYITSTNATRNPLSQLHQSVHIKLATYIRRHQG